MSSIWIVSQWKIGTFSYVNKDWKMDKYAIVCQNNNIESVSVSDDMMLESGIIASNAMKFGKAQSLMSTIPVSWICAML